MRFVIEQFWKLLFRGPATFCLGDIFSSCFVDRDFGGNRRTSERPEHLD
jgi:hypothetical protein